MQQFEARLIRIKNVLAELDQLILAANMRPVDDFDAETLYPDDFRAFMHIIGELGISSFSGALGDDYCSLRFENPQPLLSQLKYYLDEEGYETDLWYLTAQYEPDVSEATIINTETQLRVGDVVAFGNASSLDLWAFDTRIKPYGFLLCEGNGSTFADKFLSQIQSELQTFLSQGSYHAAWSYIEKNTPSDWESFINLTRTDFLSGIFLRLLLQNVDVKYETNDAHIGDKLNYHFTQIEHDNYSKAQRWIEVINSVTQNDLRNFIMQEYKEKAPLFRVIASPKKELVICESFGRHTLIELQDDEPSSIMLLSKSRYDEFLNKYNLINKKTGF
jgi:hypothetical protein